MNLSPSPVQQFFDNNGRPLVGGLLFTYEAGTSTPIATYSDEAGTPNTNPIELDFRGECRIWLDPELAYKFVLAPKGDSDPPTRPIWTADNVRAAATLAEITQQFIGERLWPRTQREIDAGVTPTNYAYPELDPRRYDTVADWSAVYDQVTTVSASYAGWYRGDRAQHPSGSNCIVGFRAYDDTSKTGTVGYRTTVFGAFAMQDNGDSTSAGGSSSAFGYASLQSAVESSGNSAFGGFSLNSCTGIASSHNNAFGYRALPSLVDGTQNNGFGFQVLDTLITGNNNHGFGENCLSKLEVGNANHAYGMHAAYTMQGGNETHVFGFQALFNQNGAPVTAISKAASAVVTISTVSSANPFSEGQPVTFVGVGGMTEINGLTGFVTALGGSSGAWTIAVAIDSSGFTTFTSGGWISPAGNSAFGKEAGFNVGKRGGCTFMGYEVAKSAEPGYGTTAIGFQAGLAINANAGGDGGDLNTLMGFWSGRQITSGAQNACFGQRSGDSLTTGSENTIVGANAGVDVTTADNCTLIGAKAGDNLDGDLNTALGYNAGTTASAQTYTNTTSIGANTVPTGSNQVVLGDSNVTTLRCQQTSITSLSDARFKRNIEPLNLPDAFLDEVEIVAFEWAISGMPEGKQAGVIAQQLDALQTKYGVEWLWLVDKSNPDRWEATPGKLLFPLIQRVQKLSRRVAALEA